MKKTWMIVGATSIIAQEFAHIAAEKGHDICLVGRAGKLLTIIAADLMIRHKINCEIVICDLSQSITELLDKVNSGENYALFIAASQIVENDTLTMSEISPLIHTNILSLTQLIHSYWTQAEKMQHIFFLSSVAACRGRAKNSLYGASKRALEIYLEGLNQAGLPNQRINIVRLGFIDTRQTYGTSAFHRANPKNCALALWRIAHKRKFLTYYPIFWRYIMGIIMSLPDKLFRKLKF